MGMWFMFHCILLTALVTSAMKPPAITDVSAFSKVSMADMMKEVSLRAKAKAVQGDECISDIQKYMNNFMSETTVLNLFIYTGKALNELGDFRNCQKNKGYFVVVGIQIAEVPVFVVGGCLPPKCDVAYLSQYKGLIVDYFNKLQNSTVFTEENVLLYNPAERNQELARVTLGTILSFMLVIIAGVAGIIALVIDYRDELMKGEAKVEVAVKEAKKEIKNEEEPPRSLARNILSCFNLGKNASSLFFGANKIDKNLDVLHGLRVFAMIWIIFGHSLIEFLLVPMFNMEDIQEQLKNSRYLAIFTAGTLAVDIFFMLSAFLATLACMQAFAKEENRKVSSVLMLYLQRYIRLLPIYVMSILIAMYIMPTLHDGPIYTRITLLKQNCSSNWIFNLLYVNNFLKLDDVCLAWTWYLSNDFQFFLIVPLISILYYKSPKAAFLALAGIVAVSAIIQVVIMNAYELDLYIFDQQVQKDLYSYYYVKPYCRINTYIMGIFAAWMYMASKDKKYTNGLFTRLNDSLKESKVVRYPLYFVGIGLILLIIFVYPDFYMHGRASLTAATVYTVLGRPAFIFGVLLIVYPGILGKCRFCAILSNELWRFMAKPTYTVYMIHLIVFAFYVSSLEEGTYFRMYRVMLNAFDVMLISYIAASVLTLLFESPVILLSKMFLSEKKEKKLEEKKVEEKAK